MNKMEYKVLIKLFVPEIEQEYELYIPVNKTVLQVSKLLNLILQDITSGTYPLKDVIHLINRRTGSLYDYNSYIRNTDIRNGTQITIF